jgi:hypothetical protein
VEAGGLVSRSAYSSTLKMEAMYSSETSVNFERITRRYIIEFIFLKGQVLCMEYLSYKSDDTKAFYEKNRKK